MSRTHIDKREVKGYLPPKYYDKFIKDAEENGGGNKSLTLAKIIKGHYDAKEPQAHKHWSKNAY